MASIRVRVSAHEHKHDCVCTSLLCLLDLMCTKCVFDDSSQITVPKLIVCQSMLFYCSVDLILVYKSVGKEKGLSFNAK